MQSLGLTFEPTTWRERATSFDPSRKKASSTRLGFLALLGRFSDLLHPATTTLMRSVRYFYFVAAIYKSLERNGVRASQVPHLSRQRQDELDTSSPKPDHRRHRSGRRHQPEAVPFGSLLERAQETRDVHIEFLQSAYQEQFDDIRRSRRGYQDDDKTPQGPEGVRFWADDLPPASFLDLEGRIRPGATFALIRAEASDLHKRFVIDSPSCFCRTCSSID